MKEYKITYKSKTYKIKAKDEASALSIFNYSIKDDKLSPMTYKQLKELGVGKETYGKWTQQQANEYIASRKNKAQTTKTTQVKEQPTPKEEKATNNANKGGKEEVKEKPLSKEAIEKLNAFKEKWKGLTPADKLKLVPDDTKAKIERLKKEFEQDMPTKSEYRALLGKSIKEMDKDDITRLSLPLRNKIIKGEMSIDDFIESPIYVKIKDYVDSLPKTIDMQNREEIRQKAYDDYWKIGSFNGKDENGKEKFDGKVKKNKEVYICVGLPAAGKSTAIANPLSEKHSARLIDSDEVKKMLPEYNGGIGANQVHEESKEILDKILDKAISDGENIVYPIVGGGPNSKSLQKKIKRFKDAGYKVHLALNDVPNEMSQQRVMVRFGTDNRFFDNNLIAVDYQDTPTANFYDIVNNYPDLIDSYEHRDNSLKKPVLVKASKK